MIPFLCFKSHYCESVTIKISLFQRWFFLDTYIFFWVTFVEYYSMLDYLLNNKLDLIHSYAYYNPNGLDAEFC